MSSSDPGRNGLAGGSAAGSKRRPIRWGAAVAPEGWAKSAEGRAGAGAAAARPIAASKNALCAAWRAASAPADGADAGSAGKACGRIGVTTGSVMVNAGSIWRLADQRAVNRRAVMAGTSRSLMLVYFASTWPLGAIR